MTTVVAAAETIAPISADEIRWTFAPFSHGEDLPAADLLALDTTQLRDYVVDLREDVRSLREVLAAALRQTAQLTAQLDRARRVMKRTR